MNTSSYVIQTYIVLRREREREREGEDIKGNVAIYALLIRKYLSVQRNNNSNNTVVVYIIYTVYISNKY